MKAFIIATAATIVIAIAAAVILNTVSMTTARTFTTDDVRL